MGANKPIVAPSGLLVALGQALITYNTALASYFSLFAHPCNSRMDTRTAMNIGPDPEDTIIDLHVILGPYLIQLR